MRRQIKAVTPNLQPGLSNRMYYRCMNKPIISLEAAHGHNLVIANAKGIPWKLPADSKHWRSLIVGHAIVVGDATFKEQGVMQDSYNVVISHDAGLAVDKGEVAPLVEEALSIAAAHESSEIFVVGGASVFAQTIAHADKLYLTIIDVDVPDGIKFFPEYKADFELINETSGHDNGLDFRFTIWQRK